MKQRIAIVFALLLATALATSPSTQAQSGTSPLPTVSPLPTPTPIPTPSWPLHLNVAGMSCVQPSRIGVDLNLPHVPPSASYGYVVVSIGAPGGEHIGVTAGFVRVQEGTAYYHGESHSRGDGTYTVHSAFLLVNGRMKSSNTSPTPFVIAGCEGQGQSNANPSSIGELGTEQASEAEIPVLLPEAGAEYRLDGYMLILAGLAIVVLAYGLVRRF